MSFDFYSLIAFLVAVAAGAAFHVLARLRHDERDCGGAWTWVLWWTTTLLGPLLLLSAVLRLFPQLWESGWHLMPDLTQNAFNLGQTARYLLALAIPMGLWFLLLLFGWLRRPRDPGRWLAGGVGIDSNSRIWVLLFALPLALILVFNHADLGGGAHAYPGAVWITLALVLLSLVGVALSAGQVKAASSPPPPPSGAQPSRLAWPEALRQAGVQVTRIASWPATTPPRTPQGGQAAETAGRLRQMGVRRVAPELVETLAELLAPLPPGEKNRDARLVFGPDDCGQVEAVALASNLLHQRFQATTLVVTAGNAQALAKRIGRWTSSPRWVEAVGTAGEEPRQAHVWVVDAEILSDRLLPKLKEPARIQRLGLVVWWQLESYTGVRAANLWAISRRLHRLIRTQGRHDVRTLALMRSTTFGSAQPSAFVRRLLPHPFPDKTVVHVEQGFSRPVHLYRLSGHGEYFRRGAGENIQDSLRHPVLVAARVSALAQWASYLEVPADVARPGDFLQLSAGDRKLSDALAGDPAQAEARLRSVEDGEVLSLVEAISQGGRQVEGEHAHHVAFSLPPNPYVGHLLTRLGESEGRRFETSRRLVGTEAHRSIFRRHLLLALNEQPDTYNGLLKNFLWKEDVIRGTLDELSHEDKLNRKEVRFLDESDRLAVDYEYASQRVPADERRPLDTVGSKLVAVRDPAAGYDREQGVRMRVDPERLAIQAYPNRVFVTNGIRYRVREWDSPEEAIRRGWLECVEESRYCQTWRIRNNFIFDVRPLGRPAGIGRLGRLLSRQQVDLFYEEEILGAIELTPDLATGQPGIPRTLRAPAFTQSFATRALILRFPEPSQPLSLLSLCQALRHVLPVHLGVEEDALEVVALAGENIDERETHGVAIVDLYPGGIGLVDAVYDDDDLILHLLEWTRTWLETCPCQKPDGCPECLRSTAALAVNSDLPPERQAALALLSQIA